MAAAEAYVFSQSLKDLPSFTFGNVDRLVQMNSSTFKTKLDKGYKFFFEGYLHEYEGKVIKCIVAMANVSRKLS